mmetsp:Transcript_106866/g.166943  ORF Transcript_106866/g.166943 Transcript_106866/m.166943 type:complete len:213 (-) Transcript_106866:114-752(-)
MAAKGYSDEDLKNKFLELDENEDGMLDFQELEKLLRKGNPNMEFAEIVTLWNNVDKDNSGKVDFDEFVDFIFDRKANDDKNADGVDWTGVEKMFLAYAGTFQEGRDTRLGLDEFMRLCHDVPLLDSKFDSDDAAKMYRKCKKKKEKSIVFAQFRKLVKLVAKKKGKKVNLLADFIATSAGPQVLYSGVHAYGKNNEKEDGYDLSFLDDMGSF